MYTVNIKTKETTSIKCNHKGCKNSFAGNKRIDLSHKAQGKGWKCVSASTHFCPDHKPARKNAAKKVNGRPSIMEQMKAPHGAGAIRLNRFTSPAVKR